VGSLTVEATDKVEEALRLITEEDISQIPVKNGNDIVGAINESSLLMKLIKNPDLKNETIESVMDAPLPVVKMDATVEEISAKINKEVGAVLATDIGGNIHIISKFDIIKTLS
jgi:cystathionine beta-synthase